MKRVTELLLGPAHKVRPSFASFFFFASGLGESAGKGQENEAAYIGVIRVVGPLLRKDEPPKISRVA